MGGMSNTIYPGKLAILQRVLPVYRTPFFDLLAESCQGGLTLSAGEPRISEAIETTRKLKVANLTPAQNLHLLGGQLYFCWQGGLIDWLTIQNPDALIVEANPRYPSTPPAIRWMKKKSRPVIGWGLGSPPLSGVLAGMRKAGRLNFVNQFDALITYSRRGATEYKELGYPAELIFVAPNAAAHRQIKPIHGRSLFFKDRASLLFVGRLQNRKRVDLLIQACAALPVDMQPRLVIVGDGPDRAELESLANQTYPMTEFTGSRYGSDLIPYYTEADLFVLPGTGGLAVQEAMSHALPVIVAQGDGTQDDLVRKNNGWQIPANDLQSLTSTLRLALSDVILLRKMGMESYRIVSEEINLEKMVKVFIDVLGKVGEIPNNYSEPA
jgi:glycosyltransferase involved in cell wall biosynthesis